MKISSFPSNSPRNIIPRFTVYVVALLLSLPSGLWATGGGGIQPGMFSPNIQQITATATDSTLVVSALVNPLSAVSEALIEYGLTTDYGGTQWSSTGFLETAATNTGDQVGSYRLLFTITGLQPGRIYHYRIFANNVSYFGFTTGPNGASQPLGGAAYSLDAIASTTGSSSPHSFEAWRQLAFTPSELADESISGPYATPQGSSPCNLVKFYFGYPPITASGDTGSNYTNLPVLRLKTIEDLTRCSLFFTRVSAVTDVSYSVETSTDAMTWQSVSFPTFITSSPTGHLEIVEVLVDAKLAADYTKAFYRVKLTRLNP